MNGNDYFYAYTNFADKLKQHMNKNFKSITLFFTAALFSFFVFGQDVPKGWHLMDKEKSGFYGISMDKAYDFVKSKNLKSNTVIVAVIDSGIDTLHEDLKAVLWKNPKEIPGNGIDDDKNGYVDDVYGWNFIGGRDNNNVTKDSYEAVRVYHNLRSKYEDKKIDKSTLSPEELYQYELWERAKDEIVGEVNPMEVIQIRRMSKMMVTGDSIIRKEIKKEEYNCKDLESFATENAEAQKVKDVLIRICKGNDNDEISNQMILDQLQSDLNKMEASDIAPVNYRGDVVKDNYYDYNDKFYGNNDVMVSNKAALHGTHVSGIIAADRKNGIGMDGVADNVKIMSLRAVPDGDEHDKDIALAIHYAVDNGAQVINMSFGKGYSPEKKWVDDAVRYAESKGVLLIHAAGNDAKNLDTSYNFPTPNFLDGKNPSNWITVGASGDPKAGGLTASFSNYGKKEVDVFAPGVKIYATVPGGDTYQNLQGTSMASPVVAGLAAMILEYFPSLSAAQVKMVIEKSAQKPGMKVNNPGTDEMENLDELCRSGGIINAYAAVKLASTLKGERNISVKTDSKVSPKKKN